LDEELRAKAVEILSRNVYRALARRWPAGTFLFCVDEGAESAAENLQGIFR